MNHSRKYLLYNIYNEIIKIKIINKIHQTSFNKSNSMSKLSIPVRVISILKISFIIVLN